MNGGDRDDAPDSLALTLSALPDCWTLLRDRRIGDGAETIEIVLIHPEIGIALVDRTPCDLEPVSEWLRRYLEGERFADFFAGELPIVALDIGPADIPVIGERLAEAFEAVPRLSIGDPDWADCVIELLLTPDDLAVTEPEGPPVAVANLPARVVQRPSPLARQPYPWIAEVWLDPVPPGRARRLGWMATVMLAGVTAMGLATSTLRGPSEVAVMTPTGVLAAQAEGPAAALSPPRPNPRPTRYATVSTPPSRGVMLAALTLLPPPPAPPVASRIAALSEPVTESAAQSAALDEPAAAPSPARHRALRHPRARHASAPPRRYSRPHTVVAAA